MHSVAELARRILEHLLTAAQRAQAGEACATSGDTVKALRVLGDVEQEVYKVTILLNVVSVLRTQS